MQGEMEANQGRENSEREVNVEKACVAGKVKIRGEMRGVGPKKEG